MNCRDVRGIADSFLRGELLTETNLEILQHQDTCAACRTEIDARSTLRRIVRDAFDRAPDLQPRPEFLNRLRGELRRAAAPDRRSLMLPRRLIAMAAGLALAAGLTAVMLLNSSTPTPSDVLAQDAIGDHRNCALKARLVRTPVPLEEAAQRFDSAFRVLLTAPLDKVSTPGGAARVVERHSCAYGVRRFGHVVLQYRGHVVSLLVTAQEGSPTAAETVDAVPHLIGRPLNAMSVVSVNGSRHAVLLVSDLGNAELTELAETVSLPLAQRLAARFTSADHDTMAWLSAQPDVDFSLDVFPFLRRSQSADELLEEPGVLRRVLEPGQKIERLTEIPAVIEATGDSGQVLETSGDVVRGVL
jgi:hypothetical protein